MLLPFISGGADVDPGQTFEKVFSKVACGQRRKTQNFEESCGGSSSKSEFILNLIDCLGAQPTGE